MAHRSRTPRASRAVPFDQFCDGLEQLLTGGARRAIVEECGAATDLGRALARLRESLRTNVGRPGGRVVDLAEAVEHHDQRTRQDGFHVLHDWDGKADRVNDDTIPVDVLDYVASRSAARRSARPQPRSAILLDYYFMHLLALLSLRIWDDGDADANLDRLQRAARRAAGRGRQRPAVRRRRRDADADRDRRTSSSSSGATTCCWRGCGR